MLVISCPWCSERDQTEFSYHGEAHIARPASPMDRTDEQWGDYLFFRSNIRGPHRERWMHAAGCRRWFNLLRDTVTGRILAVYRPDEPPPAATAGQSPCPLS